MMTCAKEGSQWLVVRESGWNISQPTGICTATISPRRSPTSRRSLPLASWVKEILEMCGRWCATQTTGSATRRSSSSTWTPGSTWDPAARPLAGRSVGKWRSLAPPGQMAPPSGGPKRFDDLKTSLGDHLFFRESTSTHQTSIPNDNRWDMTSCNCDFFPMVMSTQK